MKTSKYLQQLEPTDVTPEFGAVRVPLSQAGSKEMRAPNEAYTGRKTLEIGLLLNALALCRRPFVFPAFALASTAYLELSHFVALNHTVPARRPYNANSYLLNSTIIQVGCAFCERTEQVSASLRYGYTNGSARTLQVQ